MFVKNGLLNPNDREVLLHVRMMTELCRLRGTPAKIISGNGEEYDRLILIEDNPISKLLKYTGYDTRAGEDVMVAHVSLIEDDPIRDYPPISIKSDWGEVKEYRVDGIKVSFDKRFYMTLVLLPYNEPRNINTESDRSVYGSEGRMKANYESDNEIGTPINQPDKENPMGDDNVETGKDMVTELTETPVYKSRFREED